MTGGEVPFRPFSKGSTSREKANFTSPRRTGSKLTAKAASTGIGIFCSRSTAIRRVPPRATLTHMERPPQFHLRPVEGGEGKDRTGTSPLPGEEATQRATPSSLL